MRGLCIATLALTAPAVVFALPNDITFFGDWSDAPHKGMPGNWTYQQTWKPDRISPVGNGAAKIEVKPGDTVGGWSGERAEVSQMQDRNGKDFPVTAASGHEYYGISVKLPPGWQSPRTDPVAQTSWGIFMQLHGPDDLHASPAIALCAEKDFHLNLDTGNVLSGRRAKPRGAETYAFSDGDLQTGKWVEFVLEVQWATDHTGSIIVFRRDHTALRAGEGYPSLRKTLDYVQDEERAGWQKVLALEHVPTLQYAGHNAAGPHYWKAGFYRSPAAFTSTLFLGPVVRGKTFDAVANAMIYFP